MSIAIVLTALAVAALLAFMPRVRASRAWKATVTPLSSIMGSGFLVSAPLVAAEAGVYAPLAMAALLLVAFAIGAMIRFNILHAERAVSEDGDDDDAGEANGHQHALHSGHHQATRGHWEPAQRKLARALEQLSHVVLVGAYLVSVSYYLQLLSAFVLDRFGVSNLTWSRGLTTAVIAAITALGVTAGLRALERVETYTVSLNLGMISALIMALILHNGSQAAAGELSLPALAPDHDVPHAARVVMGLLIVVQGFETSRFLGSAHPPKERARTMRRAQIIASVIYLAFVTLMLPLLHGAALHGDVTGIVRLVAPVASVLPLLIVITAVGSQFSAAVADDAGCAGLVQTLLGEHLANRWGYLAIGVATIALTWLTDVLSVISLASRAFALFYALQCAVTAVTAYARPELPRRRSYMLAAVVLALVSLSVTLLGIPAE